MAKTTATPKFRNLAPSRSLKLPGCPGSTAARVMIWETCLSRLPTDSRQLGDLGTPLHPILYYTLYSLMEDRRAATSRPPSSFALQPPADGRTHAWKLPGPQALLPGRDGSRVGSCFDMPSLPVELRASAAWAAALLVARSKGDSKAYKAWHQEEKGIVNVQMRSPRCQDRLRFDVTDCSRTLTSRFTTVYFQFFSAHTGPLFDTWMGKLQVPVYCDRSARQKTQTQADG